MNVSWKSFAEKVVGVGGKPKRFMIVVKGGLESMYSGNNMAPIPILSRVSGKRDLVVVERTAEQQDSGIDVCQDGCSRRKTHS